LAKPRFGDQEVSFDGSVLKGFLPEAK